MTQRTYKHIFGPVASRRFGRSLGVDLVPHKTCAFDCVFCEVGLTTKRTLVRNEYVPAREILAELRDWIGSGGKADYITLCGSGEPTLHSGLGRIVDAIHKMCPIKIALLTNSSLLSVPQVRIAASRADVVKVSLSAWDQKSFERLNRPAQKLKFRRIVDGICAFRAGFVGKLWLEVVVVSRFNSSVEAMKRIARLAREFQPDRIHLNTIIRPAPERVSPVSPERLARYAPLFEPRAEVVVDSESDLCAERGADKAEIVAMLKRRPCTARDIAAGLRLDLACAASCITELLKEGGLREEKIGGKTYFASSVP